MYRTRREPRRSVLSYKRRATGAAGPGGDAVSDEAPVTPPVPADHPEQEEWQCVPGNSCLRAAAVWCVRSDSTSHGGASPVKGCHADNYKEEVADDFAYEEQNDNYMMYRSKSGEVGRMMLVCQQECDFAN